MDKYYQMNTEMYWALILNNIKLVKYRRVVMQLVIPKIRIMFSSLLSLSHHLLIGVMTESLGSVYSLSVSHISDSKRNFGRTYIKFKNNSKTICS